MNPAPDTRRTALDALLGDRRLWRASVGAAPACASTGHAALDRAFAGGWPRAAVSEIGTDHPGSGELTVLAPLLARLTGAGLAVFAIAPPHALYAPGLAGLGVDLRCCHVVDARTSVDAAWAAEQVLADAGCAAALLWCARPPRGLIRRLQLAVERGGGMGFVLRAARVMPDVHAALSVCVRPCRQGIRVEGLRRRGGRPPPVVTLEYDGAVAVRATARPAARSARAAA